MIVVMQWGDKVEIQIDGKDLHFEVKYLDIRGRRVIQVTADMPDDQDRGGDAGFGIPLCVYEKDVGEAPPRLR